jgi:hypothetical protein
VPIKAAPISSAEAPLAGVRWVVPTRKPLSRP